MHVLPRPATEPRLSPRHVTLRSQAELGTTEVLDDVLVTDLRLTSLALQSHSTEFVELVSLAIEGGSLADSDWYRTNWVDVRLDGVDAANAAFTESGMKRIAWHVSRLVGIAMSGCTLADVAHHGCLMPMANFRFANLNRVEFVGCDLTGVDFTNARLAEVRFLDCTLDGACFAHAQCDRVEVHGGTMTGLKGIEGLRGAAVQAGNVLDLAGQMAAALGIQLLFD